MNKTRNETIDYINSCQNCYCAVLDACNRPEVIFVKETRVFGNMVAIVIEDEQKSLFGSGVTNVAFTIWRKLEGYQLKGRIAAEAEKIAFSHEIEQFKATLADSKTDMSSRSIILCKIQDIYSVTPGNRAGDLLFPDNQS